MAKYFEVPNERLTPLERLHKQQASLERQQEDGKFMSSLSDEERRDLKESLDVCKAEIAKIESDPTYKQSIIAEEGLRESYRIVGGQRPGDSNLNKND